MAGDGARYLSRDEFLRSREAFAAALTPEGGGTVAAEQNVAVRREGFDLLTGGTDGPWR